MAELVLCNIAEGVGTIVLNRPDHGNAIDRAMGQSLIAAVDAIARDPFVRAVLVTGAGKAFCVGGDIEEMQTAKGNLPASLSASIGPLHEAIEKLAALPVPVVSALNGAIGGGGIGLALCADLVLAAESMKLRGGYSAIGLTPDLGASWFLARRAGLSRAKDIFYLNRPLNAAQCHACGIVDAVYPDAELSAAAAHTAGTLAKSATLSLQRIKQLVDGAPYRSLSEHLALERDCMIASARTEDAMEGINAFIEKRMPRFRGR